jgi:hypothetical protein
VGNDYPVRARVTREERTQKEFAKDVKRTLEGRPDFLTLSLLLEKLSSERLGDNDDVRELREMVSRRVEAAREQTRRALVAEVRSDIMDALPEIDAQYTVHEEAARELDDVERQRRED